MATRVKEAAGFMERILLPRLNSIDGELKSLNTRIDSSTNELHAEIKVVDTKVSEMDKRNGIQFEAIRSEISGMDKRLTTEVRAISEKVNLIREVERLKIEVAELKRRR